MTGIICLSVMVTFAQAAPSPAPASGAATLAPANATGIDETELAISETPANQTPGSAGGSFGVWDLVRMLIILGLVVASIYGVFHIVKRGSKPKPAETQLISVLGSQGLPGNRWVHLISVQKQVFLIGGSDASVNLLAEITDKESIDELRMQASREVPAQSVRFADLLGGFIGGGGSGAAKTGGLDFMKRQRDRLKKFKE